jgi:hypothetical protein
MFKVWGKIIIENKITRSYDFEDNSSLGFNDKRMKAFSEICYNFDLSEPMWLEKHSKEFSEYNRATFYPEDFVESIDFDKLVIDLIDYDEKK